MENSGLSTKSNYNTDNKTIDDKSKQATDVVRTNLKSKPNFANMIDYTTPVIRRGKKIEKARKGLTKIQEQAMQDWYIEYYFTDTSLDKIKVRVKYRSDLNKIKDPAQKEEYAQDLAISLANLLNEGYNPFNEESNQRMRNEAISIDIRSAVDSYKSELESNGSRKKTIQTYLSKLNFFIEYYPTQKVNAIHSQHVDEFLRSMQTIHAWSPRTRNAAKVILNGFFNYLIGSNYVIENPVKGVVTQKGAQQSSSHKVFSDAHLKAVMCHLDTHDLFTSLFVKAIYYTCIRPKELRQLTLSMINLDNNTITVPASIAKNKKTQTISLDPEFKRELEKYNLTDQPQNWYLFASGGIVIGQSAVGENTPYNRFMNCLDKLSLSDFGYSLYSFKHTSTVKKYLAGWSVAEIMKSNRHASITETENYLRDLSVFVDISQKLIPVI